MKQNTQEWLDFRKGKITASKIPVIMGHSPYQTSHQLFMEELDLTPPKKSTKYMEDGNKIEDEARSYFQMITGVEVKPVTIVHPDNPLFMASLDGLSSCGSVMVEIKKNNIEYHEMAKEGRVVHFHMLQMQWQMFIQGIQNCHYLSYRGKDSAIVIVPRDDTIINSEVEAGLAFLRSLATRSPPPFSEADYTECFDPDIEHLIRQYKLEMQLAKEQQTRADKYKDDILEKIGQKNTKGLGWKVTRYITKGSVSYSDIPELKGVDLNAYRKPDTTSFRITVS